MMAGTIGMTGLNFLMTGVPTFDPTQFQLPPNTTTWYTAAWDFYPTPSSLLDGGGTWDGIATPCSQCSIAAMLTMASNSSLSGNDSCYGACLDYPEARWDELVMGELIQPCDNTSSTTDICTIEYTTGQGTWYADENASNDGEFVSFYNDNSGLEGIDLTSSGLNLMSTAQGKFSADLPASPTASCTVDSQGYCVILTSEPITGSCTTPLKNVHGAPIVLYARSATYEVFQATTTGMLHLVATDTEKTSITLSPCAIGPTNWSPANPATQFNDTNLP